jgi:tRNA (Thr-GGU) A37 N-methylase
MGVEKHSEIWVIWWFNRNDNPRMRSILKVHPRLARPDSGTMRIGGLECTRYPKAAQKLVGVVPDESNL